MSAEKCGRFDVSKWLWGNFFLVADFDGFRINQADFEWVVLRDGPAVACNVLVNVVHNGARRRPEVGDQAGGSLTI